MNYIGLGKHRGVILEVVRYNVVDTKYTHLVFIMGGVRYAVFADDHNHKHMREDAVALIELLYKGGYVSTLEWDINLTTHGLGKVSISVRRKRSN